jgi:amidophosphoribosyltransferase
MTPPDDSFVEDRDGPRDECGVFGVYAPGSEVARLSYFALYALQHRGQESAGIAVADDGHITTLRDRGLVSQVFDEQKLRALPGQMAIGHVRYSTTGSSNWENSQPVHRSDKREVALAHNGNLINAVELRDELVANGVQLLGTSDSEVIAALLSTSEAPTVEDAVEEVLPRLEGAFSIVVLTREAVVAFRDPLGLRPLALGKLRDRYCVASESCAFDMLGAEFVREVAPGEMLSLGERGIDVRQVVPRTRDAFCVFEHIYFARPDSTLEGRLVYESRRRMGEMLAREAPADADIVVGVPDSGTPAANGYAQASGLPREDGLIKNRYVARTFIQPGDELRKQGLRMKFNPLPQVVGKAAGGRRRLDRARQHDAPARPDASRSGCAGGASADLGARDPPSLPLRRRHVDARGDGGPRPHARGDLGRAGGGLARVFVARGRLRGDPSAAGRALRRLFQR